MIVFNAEKVLDENEQESTIDFLKFWLFSKKIHAPTAMALIVATHISKVRRDLGEIDRILSERVLQLAQFNHIPSTDYCFHPIENMTGEGIPTLRRDFEEILQSADFVKDNVPLKFTRLLDLYLAAG